MTTQPAGINSACVNEQNSYDTPYSLYLVSTRANSSSFWIKAVCQMTYVSTKHFTDVALHCQTPGSFQYADRCSRAVIPCFHFHTFCFLVWIWLLNDPQWNHRWFVQGFRCVKIVKTNIASSRDEERGRQSSGLPTYFWLIFKTCWSNSGLSDFGEICVETKRLTQRWAGFHFVCTFKTTFSLWNSSCNFLPDPVQPPSSTNTIFNICSYCLLSSRQVPTFYYPGVDRSAQFRPADKFRLAEWMFKRINPAVRLCVTCKRLRLLLKKTLQHVICTHSHYFLPHTLLCLRGGTRSQLGQARRSTRLLRQSGDTVLLFINGIDRLWSLSMRGRKNPRLI